MSTSLNIPIKKQIHFYWRKYRYTFALLFVTITLLIAFFFYSVDHSLTGEKFIYPAVVIGAAVTHGYGPQGQNIKAKLSTGEEVYLDNNSVPLKIGDDILVIEMPRKGGARSTYIYKSKYKK